MAGNKYTIGLGIDADDLIRDTDAAIRKVRARYRKGAKEIRDLGGSSTDVRRAYQADVVRATTPKKGKKYSKADRAALANARTELSDVPRQERERARILNSQTNAAKERLSFMRRSIRFEKNLKKDEDRIAASTAEAARLRQRRLAIEKRILANAALGTRGDPNLKASSLKGVPIRTIRAQTKADRGLDKAIENDAFLKANQANEAELAKLSARDRLVKERRVRLEQAAYARAKTRAVHEDEATSAVAQESARLERRLRIAAEMLGMDQAQLKIESDITRLKAATRNAEAEVLRRTKEAANDRKNPIQQFGPTQKTSMFQRFQARQNGGDPSQQQKLGQFMKTRAISSAGFALSGVGVYGAISAMRELITESSELQVQLSLIESMWNGMDSDPMSAQIKNFGELKEQILEVSRNTATAADVTANVTRQLAGAFAEIDKEGNITPDFDRAIREGEDALKIGRVVGLPEQEITDSLTAVSLAFREQGVTFEQVGDLMVGLEAQYGVLGTELVQFTADLAPLGAELGFTAEQLTALGAVAQQSSGRSGSVIAEQLGRIIPALSDQSAKVLELFQNNTNTAGSVSRLAQAFQEGDLPTVLSEIAGNFDRFSDAQKNSLASIVGGRREAAVLFSILNDGQKTVKALGDTKFDDFAGDLDDRFDELSSNVSFKLDELRRNFEEFGLALFEAGLADAIIAIASAFSIFFQAINPVLGVLTEFNDLLGGIPLQLLLIAGGMKAIGAFSPTSRIGGMREAVTSRVSAATAGGFAGAAGRAKTGAGNVLFGSAGAGAGAASKGLVGTMARMAPVFLAFEAIGAFMDNTAKEAEAVAKLADDTKNKLDLAKQDGPQAVERARGNIESQMERERAAQGNAFLQGGGTNAVSRATSKFVNFVGGRAANAFGGNGDAALREAAGQDQNWEVLEKELARQKAEEYQGIINLVLENSDEGFVKALRGVDLSAVTDNINANKGYKSDAVKQLIGKDNSIGAGDFTTENIEALKEDALAGNALSTHILKLLSDFAGSEENAALVGAAQEIADLQGVGDELPSIEILDAQLQRGEITTASYVDKAIEIGNKWREIAQGLDEGSEKTQEYMDLAAAALQSANDAAAAIFSEDTEMEDFLTSVTAPDQAPAERAKALATRLRQGRSMGVSNEDLADTARELIEAEQQAFQDRIDATESVEEQIRMAEEGTPLSKTALVALGRIRATTGTSGDQIAQIATTLGMSVDEITDIMVNAYLVHGHSAEQSLRDIALAQFEMKKAELVAAHQVRIAGTTSVAAIERSESILADAINEAREATVGALPKGPGATPDLFKDPGNITGTAPDAETEDEKRQKAMEEQLSYLDLAAARAGDNAVELARIAREKALVSLHYAEGITEENNALAELANADRALADAVQQQGYDRQMALLDLAAARANGDAVLLAGIAQQRAALAAQVAGDDPVAQIQAQAQAVEAANQAREAANQRAQENALSRLDIASARAGDDPVAQARIARDRAAIAVAFAEGTAETNSAFAQMIEANRALKEAMDQVYQENKGSELDLRAARAGGDSVKLAKISQERAAIALWFAKTTAERNTALAGIVEADREMASALFEVFESSSNILIAQANASMDSVAAAQEQLRVLRERMAQANALGLGPAERNNLQAEIISQEAALRDAKLSEERSMIDFQLQMGTITQGQAISALQALLAIPGLAEKQIQEIQLEIKRMSDSLGSDFQFNLPTQLALPTAYEVRRMDQSGATFAGGGYNDNRNITVTVSATTNASPEQIAAAVVDVVGEPSRNGTVARRY